MRHCSPFCQTIPRPTTKLQRVNNIIKIQNIYAEDHFQLECKGENWAQSLFMLSLKVDLDRFFLEIYSLALPYFLFFVSFAVYEPDGVTFYCMKNLKSIHVRHQNILQYWS